MDSGTPWLQMSLVYLGAAVLAVPLARLLGLGSIIGYLAAGIAIGPWGLQLVTDPATILQFAQFGVVLMLFLVGLELEPRRLWALRRPIFGWGSVQLVGSTLLMLAAGVAVRRGLAAGAGGRPGAVDVVHRHRPGRAERAQPDGHHLGAQRAQCVAAAGRGGHSDPGAAAAAGSSAARTGRGQWLVGRGQGRGRDRTHRARRAPRAATGAALDRTQRHARDLHRRCTAAGGGHRSVDGIGGPVDGAGRLPGRRAAGRERIPARAGDRPRALQGPAAGPVLHCRGHEHRLRGRAWPGRCWWPPWCWASCC